MSAPVDTIVVVDCTNFNQTSANNYKNVSIAEAIPDTPVLTFSRYEILNQLVRKIYFDFDGIPDTPEGEKIPDEFMIEWIKFMDEYTKTNKFSNIKYVKTTNHHSTTHNGFSAHVICWNVCCECDSLKNSLILFTSTEAGKRFSPYVDLVVYSRLRLFKLPNFIGIPMTDENNYHVMDPNDTDKTHYIIQLTKGIERLEFRCAVPKALRRKAKKQMISPGNGAFYAQLCQTMEEFRQVFVEKKTKPYNTETIEAQIKELLDSNDIKETDKARLRKYVPVKSEQIAMAESLVKLIWSKYKFVTAVKVNQ